MGGGGGGRWSEGGDYKALIDEARAELRKKAGEGAPNVFLSFAYEDIDEINLLRAHARNEKSDIEFNDWSVKDPFDSERAAYIREKIGERISQCSTVVVFLSQNTSDSHWVEWEVQHALSKGKHVIAVHSGDKPSAAIPQFIRDARAAVVSWRHLGAELQKLK